MVLVVFKVPEVREEGLLRELIKLTVSEQNFATPGASYWTQVFEDCANLGWNVFRNIVVITQVSSVPLNMVQECVFLHCCHE